MLDSCQLSALAQVSLGFKSLQNRFFYLDRRSLSAHKIEERFILPIYRMSDLNNSSFVQTAKSSKHLFFCDLEESDLRGTEALRYIRAMGSRPAAVKKQANKPSTIEEVLSRQGGNLWYAPKATPHKANIWMRKALNSLYSPFLFKTAVILDQRCNFLTPKPGLSWELLAALLTSTVFAMSVESGGVASMGAGALELPTKILREARVPDIRKLPKKDREDFIRLAKSSWRNESPTDWQSADRPGPATRSLDVWLLERMGSPINADKLYQDLVETCRARFRLALDKRTRAKQAVQQDIESIAETIAATVRPLVEGKQFPEAFTLETDASLLFDFPSNTRLRVIIEPLMSEALVVVQDEQTDNTLLEKTYPREVADIVGRSLLLGRRRFEAPTDPKNARRVIGAFLSWMPSIIGKVEEGCRQTAVGTKFEDQIRARALRLLRISPEVEQKELFGKFTLD